MAIVNDTLNIDAVMPVVRKELLAELTAMYSQLINAVTKEIRTKNKVDLGTLMQWNSRVDMTTVGVRAAVGSVAPYAAYIELGTRPHFPPIEPLYHWVERKLDVIGYKVAYKGGKVVTTKAIKQFGDKRTVGRARQIYRVARAIQRAIGFHGTKAVYFLRDAIQGMGLEYAQATEADGTVTYNIDVIKMLQQRAPDLWQRIRRGL